MKKATFICLLTTFSLAIPKAETTNTTTTTQTSNSTQPLNTTTTTTTTPQLTTTTITSPPTTTSTTQPTTTSTTTLPPTTSTTPPPILPLSSYNIYFKFKNNFTSLVEKVGSRDELETRICDEVQKELKVSTEEFLNCTIKPGSIQVDFILYQNEFFKNHTLRKLNVIVQTNLLRIVIEGTALTTLPSSVYSEGIHQIDSGTNPPKPITSSSSDGSVDDDEQWMIVIAILIIILVIILIILVVLLLIIKHRKQKKVDEEENESTTSSINFTTNPSTVANSEATLGQIKLFHSAEESDNGWEGLSQIHHLYASQANWAFDDDQASTVDVDATSRVRFLFESQNSLQAALRDAIDEDSGKTIYDEDGTEMLTYRSEGMPDDNEAKQTLEKISEENKHSKDEESPTENESSPHQESEDISDSSET